MPAVVTHGTCTYICAYLKVHIPLPYRAKQTGTHTVQRRLSTKTSKRRKRIPAESIKNMKVWSGFSWLKSNDLNFKSFVFCKDIQSESNRAFLSVLVATSDFRKWSLLILLQYKVAWKRHESCTPWNEGNVPSVNGRVSCYLQALGGLTVQ